MRRPHDTRVLVLLLSLGWLAAAGCASLGIGIEEKPRNANERFIGALVDYTNAVEVATGIVNGWADHAEANPGSPLGPKFLKVADAIADASARGRSIIAAVVLSQIPLPESELESQTRALRSVVDELERQILAAQSLNL